GTGCDPRSHQPGTHRGAQDLPSPTPRRSSGEWCPCCSRPCAHGSPGPARFAVVRVRHRAAGRCLGLGDEFGASRESESACQQRRSRMPNVVVRYRTKPECADENQALVEKVFAELNEMDRTGLSYV